MKVNGIMNNVNPPSIKFWGFMIRNMNTINNDLIYNIQYMEPPNKGHFVDNINSAVCAL